jgi:hypothetical protein
LAFSIATVSSNPRIHFSTDFFSSMWTIFRSRTLLKEHYVWSQKLNETSTKTSTPIVCPAWVIYLQAMCMDQFL